MYDIASSSWREFKNPRTSKGNYSAPEGESVQRASEGAGVSVPELGVSWYFGGHLDAYTTSGWSEQVERVYLRSMLEFTHPGYGNDGVDTLRNAGAPEGGAYRNITQGGIQNDKGFTERADGVLVYVPGWGPNGILLGLGGGSVGDHETTDAYASMTTIDVYDIKTSEWYHQEVKGEAPRVRVNPCAVVFSAPDASSFNIYMYGGQNLLPYGEQTQYADVWILTVPAFTWIKVDLSDNDSAPAARAGHHCAARDGQMVVVGGYTGEDAACENPGVYAFDATKLQWSPQFAAAAHGEEDEDHDADNSVLAGSRGFRVPEAVQSVVGGGADGGATQTTPAVGPAAEGPFATGQPPVFTVTAAASTATVSSGAGDGAGGGRNNGAFAGQIAAGVIAGLAGLAALYLGFCAWLYRRQVGAYRRHMEVANRYNNANYGSGGEDEKALMDGVAGAGAIREKLRKHHPTYLATARGGSSEGAGSIGPEGGPSSAGAAQFGWVGQQSLGEPPWMSTSGGEVSPGSGSGSGSAAHPGSLGASGRQLSDLPRPSEDRSPWGYEGYSPLAGVGGAAAVAGAGGGGGGGIGRRNSNATASSAGSIEGGLLDGREPNFFSVVLAPRRALRVVNGMGNEQHE